MTEIKNTTQHPERKTHHRDMSKVNLALVIGALIVNIGVIFTMFNVTQFSDLSKSAFIIANILCMVLLLILNFSIISAIRGKKGHFYKIATVLLCFLLVVSLYGTYAAASVNQSVTNITSTETEESVSASLVVYDESGTSRITDLISLEGASVGFASGTNTSEIGKKLLSDNNINASFQEYQDYSAALLALFNGDIDCAIVPTTYDIMFGNEPGMSEFLEKTKSIHDFTESVKVVSESGSDKDLTKEPFTVLLVGNADGLSDTMILCSVNPISMKITMSSIARDSYVPISCYGGGSNKINSANAVSRDCLINTIENLIGVEIDYYVDTNFKGVVEVVDALGGIVINSPIEFVGQTSSNIRGTKTVWVPAGENRVNGEQALAFARERYLFATGDFARQAHQQQVIKAMVSEIMRTRDINTFIKVLQAAGNNIQTNLTIEQMTTFVRYAMQKANRIYDKTHVENIFTIANSRVTGYSSGLWDAGLQLSIYIYRLYQGSIADTREAIENNINLDGEITAPRRVQWAANWTYTPPVISYEAYNEVIIPSEIPPEVQQKDAQEQGCVVNASWNGNTCVCDGGYTGDGFTECKKAGESVEVEEPDPTETPEETATPTPEVTPSATPTPTATACIYSWNGVCYNTQEEMDGAAYQACIQQGYDGGSAAGCACDGVTVHYDGPCKNADAPVDPPVVTEQPTGGDASPNP